MAHQIDFMEKLSAALGPHGDLGYVRDAVVKLLKEQAHPQDTIEFFLLWAASNDPQLPHARWFQRVLRAFLNTLPADLHVGTVSEELEQATVPPTTAEIQESRARRVWVPGIRHRRLGEARRA